MTNTKRFLSLCTGCLAPLFLFSHARAAETLEGEGYRVQIDASAGAFELSSRVGGGQSVLTGGRLTGAGGTAQSLAVNDFILGRGRGVEVTYPDGNRDLIAVYPRLPFVTFRTTFHNGGSTPLVLNHVVGVAGEAHVAPTLGAVRTLGTGGLLAPARNPGSYAFLAVVEPQSRSGLVAGWLTHERGSGVVFSPVTNDTVRLRAQLDYGRLRIAPGADAQGEMFAVGYFGDARLGLEAYADAIAKMYSVHLPPLRPGFCTWYMEKHAGASDEKHLTELTEYAAANLKPYGFDFIQIDDGWQAGAKTNGPKKNFTTNDPAGPYPGGMARVAKMIDDHGLTPGLWFMPFAGTYTDEHFRDHPEWFAKGPSGKPFDTDWGGTCLDMTQPGARAHTREVVRRVHSDWGYRLFKLDGFWTGSATRQIYVNDGYHEDGIGETEFFNPDKTNIEALRDGVRLIRAAAGPNVFLLGCCVSQNMRSFGGSFGLLDAMRVGPDTGSDAIGAPHASRLWFLNGRVWWNDPDCVSVRASTSLEQARLNASFTAIAGNLFYNSDWMPDFPAERLDIIRRCIPAPPVRARPVDVFEREPARIWLLSDPRESRRRDVVALYNWGKEPVTVAASAERLGLPPAREYLAFDFWANQFLAPFANEVRAQLPAGGSCRILAVQPAADHPQLLSTSRHVSQGMLEVTGERWDAARHELSAGSQVVANDNYELRIAVPADAANWKATEVAVTSADQAAGVKAEMKQDGRWLRVAVNSPVGRTVRWRVKFDHPNK